MQLITLCTIFLWQWTTKWRETNPILMRVKVRWLNSERPPVLATEYFLSFSTLFWCFCRWEADFSSCSWWQADVISKWDLVRLVSTQKRPNIPYLCSTAHVGIFLLNKVWRLKTVEWCCYVLLSEFLLWLPQPPSAWGLTSADCISQSLYARISCEI